MSAHDQALVKILSGNLSAEINVMGAELFALRDQDGRELLLEWRS